MGEKVLSILFSEQRLGPVTIKNRFMAAPIFEGMATENGEVTDMLVNKYKAIARGGAGLIVPGFMYVSHLGKSNPGETSIEDDAKIPGLKRLADAVHEHEAKIFFELAHGGRQTTKQVIGETPLAPSPGKPDPVFRVKPRAMTEDEIEKTIADFAAAASRAKEAGADGIHIATAGASLSDLFLSPYFNQRTDKWGGSDENKYRFLGESIAACRKAISSKMALTVKISTNDFTPKPGVTPELAKIYAGYLARDGIDGLESSQGMIAYSSMNLWRGDVPVDDYAKLMPAWMRPIGKLAIKRWVGKYNMVEAWSLSDIETIKPALGNVPVILAGGMRNLSTMSSIVEGGKANMISIGRPMVREPDLVNKFKNGTSQAAACTSCNKCVGKLLNGSPLACQSLAT
jgi:2,4-dienoyl-CoA reductase-like NADH-dependent reductase (Old Yellow Enzyme family)